MTVHGSDTPLAPSYQATSITEDLTVLQWDFDCAYAQLSDFSTAILNFATQKCPSVLSFFTLNVSALSNVGLACVQRILGRTSLECLCIVCTLFDPDLLDTIRRILDSVRWSTAKSLVFYGSNIDKWIGLWPFSIDLLLLSLKIYGSGPDIQELSHSAALIIHQFVYGNPLVELLFENCSSRTSMIGHFLWFVQAKQILVLVQQSYSGNLQLHV